MMAILNVGSNFPHFLLNITEPSFVKIRQTIPDIQCSDFQNGRLDWIDWGFMPLSTS